MTNIKIEKGVPVPKRGGGVGGSERSSPVWLMNVGDSFFLAGVTQSSATARTASAKKAGMKFATRKVIENGVDGVRVWRIE